MSYLDAPSEALEKERLRFIKKFKEVMLANERALSDGYFFYCGDDDNDVDEKLTDMANILFYNLRNEN